MSISNLVKLKIKTMDNLITIIECEPEDTVFALKQRIQQVMNVPIQRQRLVFQGRMMENEDGLAKYKIQEDYIIHLIAHLSNSTETQVELGNQEEPIVSSQDLIHDLELLSGIIRTLRQTTYNRQNLRRVVMQQRGQGFSLEREQSLESIKQNFDNIQQMMECQVPSSEIGSEELKNQSFINPFRFSNRKYKVGQWIDLKDTIDQWLEAQVLDVKDNKIFVHYNGWGARWDEWIDVDSPRVALFRTYTVGSSTQEFMSPTPVNDPDANGLQHGQTDMNEFIFDVGFMMNKLTAMLIEFGKYQNFKKLRQKQLQLVRQQRVYEQLTNFEESKFSAQDEEDKEQEINLLALKSSLMSSQLGPLFDRLGRMMVDLAPHFAILGIETQTIQEAESKTHVFQVPVMLTPNELNQTQIQPPSLQQQNGNPFEQINSRLNVLRTVIDRNDRHRELARQQLEIQIQQQQQLQQHQQQLQQQQVLLQQEHQRHLILFQQTQDILNQRREELGAYESQLEEKTNDSNNDTKQDEDPSQHEQQFQSQQNESEDNFKE